MPTNRIPIARTRSGVPVPPEALDLFVEMRACRSSERWWNLQSQLAKLLPHRPWDWPIVQDPDDPPDWRPNESAQARWRELAALLEERDRAAPDLPAPAD
jgi:hypothetical protein